MSENISRKAEIRSRVERFRTQRATSLQIVALYVEDVDYLLSLTDRLEGAALQALIAVKEYRRQVEALAPAQALGYDGPESGICDWLQGQKGRMVH